MILHADDGRAHQYPRRRIHSDDDSNDEGETDNKPSPRDVPLPSRFLERNSRRACYWRILNGTEAVILSHATRIVPPAGVTSENIQIN
jgi:hypothetical protein